MPIRINEVCTEFGRTFTVGEAVFDLPPMEQLAMVASGFASWIGTSGQIGGHTLTASQPDVSLTTPLTTRQFAAPLLYNVPGQYSRRSSLEVGERRYVHNGLTYSFANDSFVPA
jgi:hypothetical protein